MMKKQFISSAIAIALAPMLAATQCHADQPSPQFSVASERPGFAPGSAKRDQGSIHIAPEANTASALYRDRAGYGLRRYESARHGLRRHATSARPARLGIRRSRR